MSQGRPIPLLGRIALHLKLITMDQLVEATRVQGRAGGKQNLGSILIAQGFINDAQLQQILKARQTIVAKHKAQGAVAQAVQKADPDPEVAPSPRPPAKARVATSPPPAATTAAVASSPPPTATTAAVASSPPPTATTAPVASSPPPTATTASAPAAPPRQASAHAASPEAQALLENLLRRGVEAGASDIHIHAGTPLRLRLHGRFQALDDKPMSPESTEQAVLAALNGEQRAAFDEAGELDFAYSVAGLGRFRVNAYRQQHGVDGVFRSIPKDPPTLEQLGLPTALAKFTNYHQGMVLVTGPANCGKSATLAAMVDIINEERKEHILTVEDPIEVLQPSKRCVVNQRNVGPHTASFARALRGALREDPDVIVIGELRDLETISLALTAAETGHLVLGTLHTNSSIRTINRLVGVFPADQQDQIRNMVSESLRAVISQRLVPTVDGSGRVPALEILVNNKAIGNLIRGNKTFQIFSILQTGAAQGMCLLDDSLNQLIAAGTITREEALRHCDDAKRIRG